MDCKFMIKDREMIIRIVLLVFLSFGFKYVSYNNLIANDFLGVYQLYMGGMFIEECSSMLQVIVLFILVTLFVYFIAYKLIKEIKGNEIYIRYRYKSDSKIMLFLSIKNIYYSILFQLVNVLMVNLITFKFIPFEYEFIKLFITSFIQLLIILYLSEFLLYYFKIEVAFVLVLLLIVGPVIVTGVLNDNLSSLELCKYIPFNHGNYNYYHLAKYNLYQINITYSVLPNYTYLYSLIYQLVELIITIISLKAVINKKDILGGNYD